MLNWIANLIGAVMQDLTNLVLIGTLWALGAIASVFLIGIILKVFYNVALFAWGLV